MRLRRRALLFLLLLPTWSCGEPPASTRELGSAIVRLQVTWADDTGKSRVTALGSGFLVSAEGHVVTAHHVIENGRQELAGLASDSDARLVALLPTPSTGAVGETHGRFSRVDLSVLAERPDWDLAVLELAPHPFLAAARRDRQRGGDRVPQAEIVRLSLEPPKPGTAVVLAGFPTGEKRLVVSTGHVLDERILAGAALDLDEAPEWLEPLRGRGYLFADLQTRRGHSGGPVYLPESGDVVGVCVSVMFISRTQGDPGIPIQIHHGTAATLVIPAREVVRLLDEHGVPWREAE
jgi:S1-C subfamily serine protease